MIVALGGGQNVKGITCTIGAHQNQKLVTHSHTLKIWFNANCSHTHTHKHCTKSHWRSATKWRQSVCCALHTLHSRTHKVALLIGALLLGLAAPQSLRAAYIVCVRERIALHCVHRRRRRRRWSTFDTYTLCSTLFRAIL